MSPEQLKYDAGGYSNSAAMDSEKERLDGGAAAVGVVEDGDEERHLGKERNPATVAAVLQ